MRLHPTGKFDNQAVRYLSIQAKPLAAAMGAEICGVDVAKMTLAQTEEIRHALFRHKMIFFRGQTLDYERQVAFASRLGTLTLGHPTIQSPPDQPLMEEVDSAKGAPAA